MKLRSGTASESRRSPLEKGLPKPMTSAAPTRRSLFGPGWLKIPLWALFVVPWIWPGVIVHYRHYRRYQFHEQGVRATAVVLGKHPEDHYSISFRYAVGPDRYGGLGYTPTSGVPDMAALSVGDTVPVTYLTSDPGDAILGDLDDYWRSFVLNYLALLGGSVFLTVMGLVARRSLGSSRPH